MVESTNFNQSTLNGRHQVLRDALRQVPLFSKLPEAQLQWLTEQGTEVWREPGEIHRQEGDPADHVFVMLEGQVRVYQKVGEQELVLATFKPKDLFGELPVLTGEEYFWASGRAVTRSHIFELPKDAFWQLLSSCSCVTTAILSTMARRMQDVQTLYQQREKLAALGTLAAGLAHEMNNPAAAVTRGASNLQDIFEELPCLSLKLNQQEMTTAQLEFLADLQCEVVKRAKTAPQLDPLTQSDREDEVCDWLEAHDVSDGWKLAATLVSAGLDTAWLDTVAAKVPVDCLNDVLTWITTALTGVGVLSEIEHGSSRISQLVKAIKDYSYMDQAPLQDVDLHEGLESTITILSHKLKKGVMVTREYDRSLPRLLAYGSELNQVWTNLIDNAIEAIASRLLADAAPAVANANEAMGGQGQIWVRTWREFDHVLVEVADNGPGIPPDIQHRIFEPFFTTKGVGQGTGLGLDMTYRIVSKHKGDISFVSQPGDTRFQVRVPINPQLT
jgi:signal transduction histidine kinase